MSIRHGKDRRRCIAEGTLEGLPNQCLRVGSLSKPVLNRMLQVKVCHRTVDMKQRLGCIKKDDVD